MERCPREGLEHRIAEALQDQIFCQSLLKPGIRHKRTDFLMSVHVALQDLPNLPTITPTSNGGSPTGPAPPPTAARRRQGAENGIETELEFHCERLNVKELCE
jgi:hypothetical protein